MGMQDWQETKRKIEELKRQKDRADGAYDLLVQRLKEDFGCVNLQDAEDELDQLDSQIERLESQLTKALGKFEKKYGKQLAES